MGMTPLKIIEVVEMYEKRFIESDIPKQRMDPKQYLGDVSVRYVLAHAHYLCDGVRGMAHNANNWGKTNRHLASIQMCLCFTKWYTLEQLMDHNRMED
jgi:hypothetical protein